MARDDHQDPVVRPVAGIRGGGAVDDDGGSVSDHERRSTPIGHEPRPTPIEHDPRTTVPPHEQRHPPIEHEHEHETVGGDRVRGHGGFPHERLDAYRVALAMASVSKRVAADIPRGHRSVAAAAVAASIICCERPRMGCCCSRKVPTDAHPRRSDSVLPRVVPSAPKSLQRLTSSGLSTLDRHIGHWNSNTWPAEWRQCSRG